MQSSVIQRIILLVFGKNQHREVKNMKNDIPEKGAIVQRDKETFAVVPHIPGGIIDPFKLRNFADVAEKYVL
jgi:NAD(P)H-nitrite reductase large subunit